MRFSICVPTYEMKGRGVEYLSILFSSIEKQTFHDYEVVVSDHSVDEGIENLCNLWIKRINLIYLKCDDSRGNSSVNINNAIKNAKGEFVKPMHQDDYFYDKNCLDRIDKIILKNSFSWGACGFIHTNDNASKFFKKKIPNYTNKILSKNTIGAPAVSFFKNDQNFFDEKLIWMNDAELYYRLNKKYGQPGIIKDTMIVIREWGSQVTHYLVDSNLMEQEVDYSFNKHNLGSDALLKIKIFMKKIYIKFIKKMKFVFKKFKKGNFFTKTFRFLFLEIISIFRYLYHSILKKDDPLTRLANRYRSDKGTRKILSSEGDRHFYAPIYHKYFSTLRDKKINFLEIGIGNGASVKIWNKYFKKAKLNFVDIDDFSHLNTKRIKCFIADQSNRVDLENVAKKVGESLDVITDDGGHYMEQQQVSFGVLFKYLKPGGIYFIEDLHTSYWPQNGYTSVYNDIPIDTNEDKSNSTVNMLKDYIRTKHMSSMFLTKEENDYLTQNIESCKIYDLGINKYGPNHLALITKRK